MVLATPSVLKITRKIQMVVVGSDVLLLDVCIDCGFNWMIFPGIKCSDSVLRIYNSRIIFIA
jgi:hypothetical protein